MTAINTSIKNQVRQILVWQLIIMIGLAVVVFFLRGTQNGLSVLLGGLAYWLPTLIFMLRVTAFAGAQAAKRFVLAFFTWETVKLFLSGLLFVLIVKYLPVDLFFTLLGLMASIVAFWGASIWTLYREGVKS